MNKTTFEVIRDQLQIVFDTHYTPGDISKARGEMLKLLKQLASLNVIFNYCVVRYDKESITIQMEKIEVSTPTFPDIKEKTYVFSSKHKLNNAYERARVII